MIIDWTELPIASGPAFRIGPPRRCGVTLYCSDFSALLDLPVPDDMDGRVLTELLEPITGQSAFLLGTNP